jgi:hypothetical protein
MKAKHILVTVLVSAVTALSSVFLYAKLTGSNTVAQSQGQLPVNYAGFFDGDGAPGAVDFEAAANSTVAGVVHIKTKTNPTQTNNQQKRRSPFGDISAMSFLMISSVARKAIVRKWRVAVVCLFLLTDIL